MTCSRRGFLGGCVAGLLLATLPAAHAGSDVAAPAAPITLSTPPTDARVRVRLLHAPASFVHLPSPRTAAGAGVEHRRVRMQGAPLRRCGA